MSREHELFVDLRSARRELAEANKRGSHARKQIAKIMELIDRGETQQPLLEVIERNGRPPEEPESADERQRGSTAAPTPPPKRKPKTERADRREVVISPNGPIRQTEPSEGFLDAADIEAETPITVGVNAQTRENGSGPAKPKRKTFAVYVRDPVTGKAARGLGYVDATSKDKALALAAKRWPAVKPTELLISPPGWEQSPPPAEPERPKPIGADPSAEWRDSIAQDDLEHGGAGEPDPADRPEGAQHDSTGQRPVSQWAASVPVRGVKGAQEFLGSFLATDTEDALAVARARWPGRPDIAVRRAGPPAEPTKPKARKAVKV